MENAKLNEMDSKAMSLAFRIGVGIVKITDQQGRIIECKSRLNHGKSGKAFTTIWYVDGKRTAREKILGG